MSGLLLGFAALLAVIGVFFGTEGITVSFIREIENPKLWHVLLTSGALAGMAAVPFFVLISKSARAQFGRECNRGITRRSTGRREPGLRGD